MKYKDDRWEVSGSLTPELEGTPHSGLHKKRTAHIPTAPQDTVASSGRRKDRTTGRKPADSDANQ